MLYVEPKLPLLSQVQIFLRTGLYNHTLIKIEVIFSPTSNWLSPLFSCLYCRYADKAITGTNT